MKRTISALLAAPFLLLAGCDNPPPPTKVEVDVTVKQAPKPPHPPKGKRGVIVGDEQKFTRP